MSVVFTTISNNFIAMCADQKNSHPAIEKWAPTLAVGMGGDLTLGEYIRSTVHRYVTETGIANFGVEEIADLFIQSYHTAVKSGEVSQDAVTKFIIAGKFTNKKFGATVIKVGGNNADTETYEAAKMPATLILEPEDLSAEECNMLLAKALKNVEGKYLKNPLESIHRRAVRNVSEHSEFVDKDSDFFVLLP